MAQVSPYKIKHVPTGLYYQPVKGSSNLGKSGKIYTTKVNGVFDTTNIARGRVVLSIKRDSTAEKKLIEQGYTSSSLCNYTTLYYHVPIEDFVIEDFHC